MRILLVEDDRKINSFVAQGFEQAGYAVDRAEDGEQGLSLAEMRPYDAAVVDVMLPGLDGLALIESLRQRKITMPVLILSAKSGLDDKIRGLRRGGDDYVTKPFSFSELLVRVQTLVRRSTMSCAATQLRCGDLTLDPVTREVRRGEAGIDLQPKEFSLLEYMMRNAGSVLSKTMIMDHIWGYDFDPQTNPVDVLMHRLRSKIEIVPERKLIRTIRGVGYVLKES